MRYAASPFGAIIAAAACGALFFMGCTTLPGTGGAGGLPFNLPPTPVIAADLVRGVAPLTVQFSSDQSTDDGLIIARLWDFGDSTTSPEISPRHTFSTTGAFTVTLTLTDDSGSQASRTITINVTEAPVAVITVDRTAAESAPAVFEFDASDSFDPDGEIIEYRWDFGDGSREFLQSVAHTFPTAGTFRVELTVTDDTGVTGTGTVLIQVGIPKPSIELRVPPAAVKNIIASQSSPLWVQAVFQTEPQTPRFIRAGIDGDQDVCEARAVLFDEASGDDLSCRRKRSGPGRRRA